MHPNKKKKTVSSFLSQIFKKGGNLTQTNLVYLLLIIELYVICHMGGYDLGFIQFFLWISLEKK
jgi:hypothetical protein